MPFANIYHTATATDSLPIINTGSAAVSVAFENVPPHLSISALPQRLNAGEKGSIVCTYNAAKKNDWGYVTDKVSITLNGAGGKDYELVVSANIDEDFSGLKDELLANAPAAKFARRTVDLGSVAGSASKDFTISIANEGRSDLLLRKITSGCSCITLAGDNPKSIKPGQAAELKATFSAGKLKGKINKNVTVITNTPKQPSVVIRVSAVVN
jgi:ribosomal protein L30E